MGFFAVIRDSAEAAAAFRIKECHVNLWSLGGLGRRVFTLDVGLWLEATRSFSAVRLAIPFGTSGHQDLSHLMKNQQIADLIFGGPVPAEPISSYKAAKDESLSGKDHSVWNIELAQTVNPEDEVYLRVRFDISDKGRGWIWKRWLLAAYGALVDVRIAEVREAVGLSKWDGLIARIVPIETLNLFIVAPSTLQAAAISPTPRYIRVLEGKAWVPYIGRAPDLFRSGKLIVYYWRYRSEDYAKKVIEPDYPFRAFLDLNRPSTFANPVVAIVLALSVVVAGSLIANHDSDIVSSAAFLWGLITAALAAAGLGLVTLVMRIIPSARNAGERIFLAVENALYKA